MLRHVEFRRLSAVLAVVLLATTSHGQSPDVQSANMETEIAGIKAENTALREQLNKVEEQQKILLDVVNDLKQRLGLPAISGGPSTSSQQNFAAAGEKEIATSVSNISVPSVRALPPGSVTVARAVPSESQAAKPEPTSLRQTLENRYRDGIVIWETPEDAKVPFLLRLQGTTQLRYINTL